MRRVIRQAPFWIVDPLVVLRDGALSSVNGQGRKTLIVAEFTVPHDFPVGTHTLNMRVRHGDHVIGSSQQQVTVAGIQLSDFPKLDSVHWLSMAPRNLIARPENVSVSGHWGPPWWSDAHWTLIERGAKILHEMGNTMMFVPLFVRNPTEPEATPLIKTRCITGSTTAPVAGEPNFNDAVKGWRYAFDFGDFKHAIRLFDGLGFKRFDGAHLMAFGGELPTQLACDLYESANAPNPYKKGFVFMPRKTGSESEESYKFRREVLYPGSYLETFLPALRQELAALGVEGRYLQHVTDENSSGDNPAYKQAVALVRKHLPKAKIIDAISNSWDSYVNTVDYPVMNIMFYYKALKYSAALRQAKQGGLFYYNTGNPTPAVGPNRGLDEHLLNMRVYPWLAIEKNLSGYLYWASNEYRYPWKPTNERPQDWTPYRYSLGPTPSGAIQPAHPPGNNWFLYPTASGLTTSLRAVAYYEGVVDHWLFRNAQVRCKESPSVSCRTLGPAMQSILRNSEQLNDYSTNAADYEAARRSMVSIVSGNGDEPAREAGRGERSERRWRSMRPH